MNCGYYMERFSIYKGYVKNNQKVILWMTRMINIASKKVDVIVGKKIGEMHGCKIGT